MMTMELIEFGKGTGFLRAGLLGFPKSGKTWTAMLMALELWKLFGMKTPIAMLDTEGGGEYIAPKIKEVTGLSMIGVKSRSFRDLVQLTSHCESGAAEILIVDSVTHPWSELKGAYLEQINKARVQRNLPIRQRLEFQDWQTIKDKWNTWSTMFLNAKLHIIVCGRAGYEWDFQDMEGADGKVHKELIKTGIKMRVENEFGFESSLLIEMERVQVSDNTGHFRLVHRCTILGDRFNAMDGKTMDNPAGEFFLDHLKRLKEGALNVVDTALKTEMGVDESGDAEFQRMRRERTKLLEEIQNEIVLAFPGQSAAEKKSKALLVKECFGTGSWTAVESMRPDELSIGLERVRAWIAKRTAAAGVEG